MFTQDRISEVEEVLRCRPESTQHRPRRMPHDGIDYGREGFTVEDGHDPGHILASPLGRSFTFHHDTRHD